MTQVLEEFLKVLKKSRICAVGNVS